MTAGGEGGAAAASQLDRNGARPGLDPVREVLVVAGYELRAMLFGVRALLLFVVYGGATFAIGAAFVFMKRKAMEQIAQGLGNITEEQRAEMMNDARIHEELVKAIRPVAEWLGGQPLVDAITNRELPWVVLFVLLFSTFLVPGLVLLVGYDRIGDDLSTRFARYVLQRVRRGTWLAGKLLGHFGAVLIVMVAAQLVLVAIGSTVEGIDAGEVIPVLPRLWLALAVFILAYASFTALVSATISPPFAALAIGGVALTMLWLFSTFSDLVRRVWMGTWDMRLWVLDPTAIAVFLAHAAVFTLLAWARLRTRDV